MRNSLEDARKRCGVCDKSISARASVCPNCQRSQNWVVRHLPNFSVAISIGLLLLAYLQFWQAWSEAKDAFEARQTAELVGAEMEVIKLDAENALAAANEASQGAQAASARAGALSERVDGQMEAIKQDAENALAAANEASQGAQAAFARTEAVVSDAHDARAVAEGNFRQIARLEETLRTQTDSFSQIIAISAEVAAGELWISGLKDRHDQITEEWMDSLHALLDLYDKSTKNCKNIIDRYYPSFRGALRLAGTPRKDPDIKVFKKITSNLLSRTVDSMKGKKESKKITSDPLSRTVDSVNGQNECSSFFAQSNVVLTNFAALETTSQRISSAQERLRSSRQAFEGLLGELRSVDAAIRDETSEFPETLVRTEHRSR